MRLYFSIFLFISYPYNLLALPFTPHKGSRIHGVVVNGGAKDKVVKDKTRFA